MIGTASGWQLFVGPAITASTDTEAEYAALAYTAVGEIETLGEFGDEAADVTFAAIGDARVRHLKGARDAGSIALTVAHDALDVGQQAMVAAEKTNYEYAIKITAKDAPTDGYTDSVFYFRGSVRSARLNVGENDNVVRRTFNVGISSAIIEVPAEVIP